MFLERGRKKLTFSQAVHLQITGSNMSHRFSGFYCGIFGQI